MSAQGTPNAAGRTAGVSQGTAKETPKGAWTVTFLLFLFMLVNFADKIVVGLAGVPIMTDLKLEPEQFGLLGSSFFFLFSISAIVVGFIVNKVATRWVLLTLAVIWALAQFPMVGTVSFTTLLICRVVLGAGEGPAASVAMHAVYKWFPDEKRTLPTAILSQGSAFGVILAVPALNWVIVNHSWHYAFGALGVVGLIWVCAWLIFGKEGPLENTRVLAATETKIPYVQLLTSRTFLGCVAATFGAYWALSLGLTWFTSFMGLRRGAVDFVGQQHLREDGARVEAECIQFALINRDARHIGRQQVAGELDAVELQAQRQRQGVRKRGLADARQVFEQ